MPKPQYSFEPFLDLAAKGAPYTTKNWIGATNLAALMGWIMVTLPFLFPDGRFAGFTFLGLAAGTGLPIAFLLSWLVGAPVLWRIMQQHVTWPKALIGGLLISSCMAVICFGLMVIKGVQFQSLDIGIFLAKGMVISMVVRAIWGPGKQAEK